MSSKQQHATEFETFYKDVRSRLLLQTWSLTGDLTAGRKAVQDALIIAWHHWRKVGRLTPAEREDWARPIAWRYAQRRHSVPHFHRSKDGDDQAQATIEALRQLPLDERKVLLLAHLTTISEDVLAREVGVTQLRAAQLLQNATRDFSLARGATPTEVLPCFTSMATTVESVRWPRPTILTRAGSARRRTHTVIALGLAVAAFAGSGFAVTDAAGDRPSLESLSLRHQPDPATASPAGGYELAADSLVDTTEVGAALGGAWTATLTSDDRASAVQLPCQRAVLADPHPQAVVGRSFVGAKDSLTTMQSSVASSTTAAAEAAYAKALGWYGGCRDGRVQLLATESVTGVGDQASVLLLRDWQRPQRTIAVGVARTGVLTTAIAGTLPVVAAKHLAKPTDDPVLKGATTLLGNAVQRLCELPDAGACTTTPATVAAAPPPAGTAPAMINEVDLPPVAGVDQPWVGTAATKASTNTAATRCDDADFSKPGITRALTRSFVIPTAKGLAPQFGLTETIGDFGKPRAAGDFIGQIRDRMAACSEKDLGSHVTRLTTSTSADGDLAVWRVQVETSKDSASASVTYLMAIVRSGSGVAQVGFVPSGKVTMTDADFTALARRAAERLTHLR